MALKFLDIRGQNPASSKSSMSGFEVLDFLDVVFRSDDRLKCQVQQTDWSEKHFVCFKQAIQAIATDVLRCDIFSC